MSGVPDELVLVHGWGVNRGVWGPLAEALAPHRRVQSIDLLGYDDGRAPSVRYDLDAMAADLLTRAPQRSAWVAWSLGGLVAMRAAVREPHRVSRLHLVGASPRFVTAPDWPHGVDAAVMQRLCRDLSADYRGALGRYLLLQAGDPRDGRALARRLRPLIERVGAPRRWVLEASLAVLQGTDLRGELDGLTVPVHLIHGERDRLAPIGAARYLADRLPGARLTQLSSGHAPFASDPVGFAQDLLSRPN